MTTGCCLPGEMVLTSNGACPIEDIQVGDTVLTHENRWRKVIKTMSRDFDGPIYNIQTYCSAEQWLTGEHPVLTMNPRTGQQNWVRAEELVPGKRIQMNGPHLYHNLMILPKNIATDDADIDMGSGPVILDPELAYFLGIFVSEGSFKCDPKGSPYQLCLSLNNGKDKSFIPRLEAVVKRFSDSPMHYHERPHRHTIDLYWSDKRLAATLLSLCNSGALNKRIPPEIFRANKEIKQAFFDGLIDGDGSRKPTQTCLRMVSKNVVYGARYIAASLGLIGKIFESKALNRLTCYQIAWSTNPKYRRYLEDDNNFYLPLRRVDTRHYKGPVYNIAVEEDHSYVTQFAVHNCELYRVMIPFKHLIDQGYRVGWCGTKDLVNTSMYDWDVIVLPRLGLSTYDESDMFIKAMKEHGKAIIYEVDDDFVHLPEDNPAHQADNQAIQKMMHLMVAADMITVSTPTLAKVMKNINPNIYIAQNCIDPDMWTQVEKEQERVIPNLTIGMHGGNSHYEDWKIMREVFPVIAKKYPEVKIVVSGFQPDYLMDLGLGEQLIKIEWTPVRYYHAAVFQIDIGLCPLLDTEFNRSKCVTSDTLLSTPKGIMPITSLIATDKIDQPTTIEESVLTTSGFCQANASYCAGEQPTMRIITKRGYSIEGTLNHRLQDESGEWHRLDSLQLGDQLSLRPMQLSTTYLDIPFNCWAIRQRNLSNHLAPSLPKIKIDENFGLLFGFLIGDGHLGKNCVRVTCDAQDTDVMKILVQAFDDIGVKSIIRPRPKDGRKCQDVIASSARFNDLLLHLGLLQNKRKVLEIPWCIMQSPSSVVRRFLQGLFESDGTLSDSGVTLCSKNKKLIQQVQILLSCFGILSSIQTTYNRHYNRNYFVLRLTRAATDIFVQEIGFISRRKNEKLDKLTSKAHSNAYRPQVWADEIVALEPGQAMVYDICVPETSHYIGNCFVSHNSVIKALETGILGRPVVASPTVYNEIIEHNTTGFIAQTPDDWINYISRLVENPRLRRRLGANLRGRILAKHNIHKEAWRWMKAYQLAWDKARTRA